MNSELIQKYAAELKEINRRWDETEKKAQKDLSSKGSHSYHSAFDSLEMWECNVLECIDDLGITEEVLNEITEYGA